MMYKQSNMGLVTMYNCQPSYSKFEHPCYKNKSFLNVSEILFQLKLYRVKQRTKLWITEQEVLGWTNTGCGLASRQMEDGQLKFLM